ncbi:MAG: hypothetical protein KDD64_00770 [Bdellovibrionales bacterium]|nr:hypothetical protein [Bdellovibrionales bacterium]
MDQNPLLTRLKSLKQWQGGKGYTIDSIRLAAENLGDPQEGFRTIHVTGTNGKGSTAAMIAAGLGSAGFKVGLFTSPHLSTMNERFCIDGTPLSDAQLEAVLESIVEKIGESFFDLSFFEACTIVGFQSFWMEQVDFGVIEVGLGGTLDATNVIKCPELAVITSISLDHENVLGNTEEAIARDKCGIIKPGTSVFVGQVRREIRDLIEAEAQKRQARNVSFFSPKDLFSSQLRGEYQALNSGLARSCLRGLGVSEPAIERGFASVVWPGRMEEVRGFSRPITFECAHNIDGIRKSCRALGSVLESEPTIAFGVLETKQWREMLGELLELSRDFLLLEPDSSRSLPQNELQSWLTGNGVSFRAFGRDYSRFITDEIEGSDSSKPLVLIGSIYLVGAIRGLLGLPFGPLWQREHV